MDVAAKYGLMNGYTTSLLFYSRFYIFINKDMKLIDILICKKQAFQILYHAE